MIGIDGEGLFEAGLQTAGKPVVDVHVVPDFLFEIPRVREEPGVDFLRESRLEHAVVPGGSEEGLAKLAIKNN